MKLVKLKTIALFFACVFFLTYVPACAPQENIKVGVLGTMSGINSDLSVSGRRGVEMAVEEINQKGGIGGRMVELVIKDDQNDPAIAQKAYEEFVAEKIPAVIGPYTSGMIVGSIEYIRKQDILLLGPTISADVLSNTDDNFIRFIASTQEQAVALTNIAKKNNDKNFVVIYDSENKGFNEDLFNNFKALLKKNNGKVVLTATFSSQENTGFSALANQIVASGADGVFIIANSACNAELSQQIRKTSSQIHIYSPLWANTSELIKKGGSAVEGMLIVGGIDSNDHSPAFISFKEKYIEKFDENPTFSSVYSYETALALFKALEMGPDLTPANIKKNIISIENFEGLQSTYEIDKYGDNTRKYMIFKIKNGELARVDLHEKA